MQERAICPYCLQELELRRAGEIMRLGNSTYARDLIFPYHSNPQSGKYCFGNTKTPSEATAVRKIQLELGIPLEMD